MEKNIGKVREFCQSGKWELCRRMPQIKLIYIHIR